MNREVDRREFVRKTAGMAVGAGIALAATQPPYFAASEETVGAGKGPKPDWRPGDPIGYINPTIPDFAMPPYEGQRYEAVVPDTLDLAERARLAVNALTEMTDP
jgi:hypothetical protein